MPDPKINRLAKEKSPYLLQHKENPVHWYPWGEEAFRRAREENKPVFLSIGYSTCHWCHVMAHESFENQEIADILNQYFIAIKVDREERPDLDNIYMKAVVSITGQGGWPLSVFLTPDKKPFFGGTYFPPEARWNMPGFKQILNGINDAWQNQQAQIVESSQALTQNLQEGRPPDQGSTPQLDQTTLEDAFARFVRVFDEKYGGFGSAPKFPSSHNLSFLLRYFKRTGHAEALAMVEKTLQAMANGGMCDQIGGGFHRYSTDQKWHIPHFEKMLYDQATLATTYLEAYQVTHKEEYAQTVREVFDYVLRDLRDAGGGFYCAEDADSFETEDEGGETRDEGRKTKDETSHVSRPTSHVKKEGAFYLWRQKGIEDLLGERGARIINYYFGVEADGNAEADPHGEFVGKNTFYVAHDLSETAGHFKTTEAEVKKIIEEGKGKLFSIRGDRPRPHLDDKILVDWNGLMISALAFGARVLDEPRYAKAAEDAAQFILRHLVRKDGRLLHRYRDGEAAILGTIDDYAFFIQGLMNLYEATFNPVYLKEAKRLTGEMVRLFWDGIEGGFFFTAADGEELIVREKAIYDGAVPSGNAVAALDLLRLGRLTGQQDLEQKAQAILGAFSAEIAVAPYGYTQSLIALDFGLGPVKEIVISAQAPDAPGAAEMIKIIYGKFIPNKVVIFRPASEKEAASVISLVPFVAKQTMLNNQPTAYVCQSYHCEFPTTEVKRLEELLIQ